MATAFPASPYFTDFSEPMRLEADLYDLEVVQGEVPRDLNGVFFRVQPDPQWPPKMGWDIPLNGDGMITAFYFNNGAVDFKSRYVRTQKFVAERNARKSLFGIYRNPYTDDPSVKGLSRGTANTSMLWFAGKLLALKEDSLPIELDPFTLDTIDDAFNFSDQISSPTFTAHPKIDPVSGDLLTYGYSAKGEATRDFALYVISPQGEVLRENWFEAPYGCMIHDFGATQNHLLVPITPLCSDPERLKEGGAHFAWEGDRPSYLGIVSREQDSSDVRWVEGPTCHATHTMNAFAEGRKVHYDTPTGATVVFPFFPARNGERWNPADAAPRLTRWTVDLDNNNARVEHKVLTPVTGDFPRIDDRVATLPYRYGWIVGCDESNIDPSIAAPHSSMISNAIIQHDVQTGERKVYNVGPGSSSQEPQFVPRSADAPEGDGYLIMVVHRVNEMRSDLAILDTKDISGGPIATLKLPFRLRRGLHGAWAPAAELERARRQVIA